MKCRGFCNAAIFAGALAVVMTVPLEALTTVKLASVSPEYWPTAGPGLPEPVSMQDFWFQINWKTQRVRLVVDYAYPDQAAFEGDGGAGPEPTMLELPGLRYDSQAKVIIYSTGGKTTVCASVAEGRKSRFWKSAEVTPSGSCIVKSVLSDETKDDGWDIRHVRAIETYLVVR